MDETDRDTHVALYQRRGLHFAANALIHIARLSRWFAKRRSKITN
jgi:hypothetical protein